MFVYVDVLYFVCVCLVEHGETKGEVEGLKSEIQVLQTDRRHFTHKRAGALGSGNVAHRMKMRSRRNISVGPELDGNFQGKYDMSLRFGSLILKAVIGCV